MRRVLLLVLALALGAAGCGTDGPAAGGPTATADPQPTTTVPGPSPSTTTTADAVPAPDLTVFVAAVDAVLADTSYEGTALTEAELFIATGQLFCELLDAGATSDEVLADHLDALTDAHGGALSDDDVLAAGAVMGASVEVICPQHSS